jgi:hypothetical protein
MKPIMTRARDLLPAILITVLSMIQALALELYWSKIGDSDYLWLGGWNAAIGWLQLAIVFLGIVLIWLLYVSSVLRFSWVPAMEDTVIPFFIGLLEFAMIDLIGPETLGPWFLVLAAIFAVSTGANHMVMRRARRDPANAYFFEKVAPARWRDYTTTIVVIAILALLGVTIWWSGPFQGLSIAALLFAFAALGNQLRQTHRYWMHSLTPE